MDGIVVLHVRTRNKGTKAMSRKLNEGVRRDEGTWYGPNLYKPSYKIYLFEYHFEGSVWQLDIPATSQAEAEVRMKCISHRARYVGELGWAGRLWCVIKNFFRSNSG